jgi:DNA-binding transcriptional LysR family regulator
MTLTQLRYLLAIVDADLNVSLAAVNLGTTQPGMSKQLRLIEDELGFLVFVRKGKSLLRLTEEGARILTHARTALREIDDIRTISAEHRGQTRGQLRLATPQTLGRYIVAPVLARLKARFPGVAVLLKAAGEVDSLSLLERDQADLAIVSTEGDRPAGDLVLPLFRRRRVLIAPSAHPMALAAGPVQLADLAGVPLVTYESAATGNSRIGRTFLTEGVQPNIACTARDADTIKTCVRLGLGIGLIPEVAIDAADGDLKVLGGEALFPECVAWAVTRRERVRSDLIVALLMTLAPALSRDDVQRVLESGSGGEDDRAPAHWREIFL